MKKITIFVLLSFLIGTNLYAQGEGDSLKTKIYDSPEDSIVAINQMNQLDALTLSHEQDLSTHIAMMPDIKITPEYSGLFYLNANEAVYNFRYSFDNNFLSGNDFFDLNIDFLGDNNVVLQSITTRYDTVDCGSFIIRIPITLNLKALRVSYKDQLDRIAIIDYQKIKYQQNELLHVSEQLYNTSSKYFSYNAIHKQQDFKDFILNEVTSENVFEGLTYVQNQFNIFPPIQLTGALGNLATNVSPVSPSPIDPCDPAFITEWINSMQILYGFDTIPYYQIRRCLKSTKYNLLNYFDNYVKTILPEWKSWRENCSSQLSTRAGELECDCQRVVPITNLVNSGSFLKKTTLNGTKHKARAALSHINGQRNLDAHWKTEGQWGDPDCRAVLQGFTWGPANWLNINSNGGCCNQNQLKIKYGDTTWTNSTPGANSPLYARMRVTYSCINDDGYFPDDCKCPLSLKANFYLESILKSNATSNWDCTWSSVSKSSVENLGMAVMLNEYQELNPSPIIWESNRVKVYSKYKSSFNTQFIFDGIKTLGNVLTGIAGANLNTLSGWGTVLTTTGTQINNYLNSTPAPVNISSVQGGVKNEILVDKSVSWPLQANVPVVMQLNNFISLMAGGEDGFNSNAWINSGFAMDFYIEPQTPSPSDPNDMYCCHEFSGAWIQHDDCLPYASSYTPHITSHMNGSTSAYTVGTIGQHDYDNYITTRVNNCDNFSIKYSQKPAPIFEDDKVDQSMATFQNNKLLWNRGMAAGVEYQVSDILGRVIETNKLNLDSNDVITDFSKYRQRVLFISVYYNGKVCRFKIGKTDN